MIGGYLVYKCRNCGEIDKTSHVPDVYTAFNVISSGRPTRYQDWTLDITDGSLSVHGCKDGLMGVSDLIAFEKDAIETAESEEG